MAELAILLPELRRIAAAPSLKYWLARGDRQDDGKPGRDAALRECFEFTGTSLPVAALTRSLDAGDADGALWVRADPCHVSVDAVAVRMLACGNLDLSREESDELARALRPLFGDAGFPLEAATPQRWYLRAPREARLPAFTHPDDMLGADLLQHLPTGDNQRQWRHLLNEAQVILHNHPVNAQRVRRGRVPANSLWFWGAGVLPAWVRCSFGRAISNDELVLALSLHAKVPSFRRKPESSDFDFGTDQAKALDPGLRRDDERERAGSTLLDLGDVADAAILERDWFAPIADAQRTRKLAAIKLLSASGERIAFKHAHRWRFWRRMRG